MALKNCPKCGTAMSAKAVECPGCGQAIAVEPTFERNAAGCLAVIILVALVFIVHESPSDSSPPAASAATASPATSAPSLDKSALADALCKASEDAVIDRLKAPATAKFPDCTWEADKWKIILTSDHKMAWAESYVDAQNSFSALIRTKFIVLFKIDPTAQPVTYSVTDVEME